MKKTVNWKRAVPSGWFEKYQSVLPDGRRSVKFVVLHDSDIDRVIENVCEWCQPHRMVLNFSNGPTPENRHDYRNAPYVRFYFMPSEWDRLCENTNK